MRIMQEHTMPTTAKIYQRRKRNIKLKNIPSPRLDLKISVDVFQELLFSGSLAIAFISEEAHSKAAIKKTTPPISGIKYKVVPK